MKLKRIHIKNVLSYKDTKIDFSDGLNVFVGANGSGKSNLLNIVIYVLKKYCYQNYDVHKNNDITRILHEKYTISERNPLYNAREDTFLRKHKLLNDLPSEISFTIKFEDTDIDNLKEMQKHKIEILDFIARKVEHITPIDMRFFDINMVAKGFFGINHKNIKANKEVEIQLSEKDGIWYLQNNADDPYMLYVRNFSLFLTLLNLMGVDHNVKNPFVFFEAYRNNAQNTTWVSISDFNNQGGYVNMQSVANMSSIAYSLGVDSTYIMMATKKYGALHRQLIEQEGGREKFDFNPEYLQLKAYFKKFDYDINIRCVVPNNNIYQFYLKKDGLEVEIDTISSGEREIVNFIFGLFLEQLSDCLIIIDEPELHLHPSWQKKLINILKQETLNKNVQIMFVTHSSGFISLEVLNDIYRIYKNGAYSEYVKISDVYKNDFDVLRKQLGVINATNNEKIFFASNVILVEGITDEILFKTIYEKEFDIPEGVEFVGISGKGNLNIFGEILKQLKIPYYYIGDYDNLYNVKELKKYFTPDLGEQKRDLGRSKNQSYDCLNLLASVRNVIEKTNGRKRALMELRQNFEQYNERFLSVKKDLTDEEKQEIDRYIEAQYTNNVYILKGGEIEQYLGVSSSNKAGGFKRVIAIRNDNNQYAEFAKSAGFKELRHIIEDINKKIREWNY